MEMRFLYLHSVEYIVSLACMLKITLAPLGVQNLKLACSQTVLQEIPAQ